MRCGHRHPVTRHRCTRPIGHTGYHAARCRARVCGGYGREHEWA